MVCALCARTGSFRPHVASLGLLSSEARLRAPSEPIYLRGQARWHGGHAHEHVGHAGLAPGWQSPAQRITLLGLLSNVGLTGAKVWAGYYYGSSALVADGLHSLSDMASDVVTLAALRIAARRPSPRFPSADGLRKVEPLGAMLVSTLLLAGGAGVGWSSLVKVSKLMGFDMHVGHHSHEHGAALLEHAHQLPLAALGLAVGVIAIKEALFQATMVVARREESTLLRAQAWHHRADALTTLIAVAAVGGSALGVPAADPLGGLLVSVLVGRAGFSTLRSSFFALMDAADPALTAKVQEAASVVVPSASDIVAHRRRGALEIGLSITPPPGESVEAILRQVANWESALAVRLATKVRLTVRISTLELRP